MTRCASEPCTTTRRRKEEAPTPQRAIDSQLVCVAVVIALCSIFSTVYGLHPPKQIPQKTNSLLCDAGHSERIPALLMCPPVFAVPSVCSRQTSFTVTQKCFSVSQNALLFSEHSRSCFGASMFRNPLSIQNTPREKGNDRVKRRASQHIQAASHPAFFSLYLQTDLPPSSPQQQQHPLALFNGLPP